MLARLALYKRHKQVEQNSDANECEQRGAVCQWHTAPTGAKRRLCEYMQDCESA